MNSSSPHHNITHGWVPPNSGRGTFDILSSCLLTIFLCCWTSVCVNIPATTESKLERFLDKAKLAAVGILGPDFLCIIAIGQYESAKRSLNDFHKAGFEKWTIRQAFFADMGGFLLTTPDEEEPQPLNGELLLALIRKGYVSYPEFDEAAIDDKNKFDGLARLITVVQALIFATTSFGRLAAHLAITTLELTTLAFIFAMLATSFFWRDKPQDVTRGVVLESQCTLRKITIEVH
ncbi:hypothetical protein MMC28_006228 [Mycoblastus sanguinarius]|nr:hypothetical protein [Mycoblastus sanguinarius]